PGKLLDTPGGQAYGSVQQHRPGYPLGGFWLAPPLRCGVDQPPAGVAIQPCGNLNGAAILTTAGAAIFNSGDTAKRYYGSSTPTCRGGCSSTPARRRRRSSCRGATSPCGPSTRG